MTSIDDNIQAIYRLNILAEEEYFCTVFMYGASKTVEDVQNHHGLSIHPILAEASLLMSKSILMDMFSTLVLVSTKTKHVLS